MEAEVVATRLGARVGLVRVGCFGASVREAPDCAHGREMDDSVGPHIHVVEGHR